MTSDSPSLPAEAETSESPASVFSSFDSPPSAPRNPCAETTLLPPPFPDVPAAAPSDLSAATMMQPAPLFGRAYKTPREILEVPPPDSAEIKLSASGTMLLPPPDFAAYSIDAPATGFSPSVERRSEEPVNVAESAAPAVPAAPAIVSSEEPSVIGAQPTDTAPIIAPPPAAVVPVEPTNGIHAPELPAPPPYAPTISLAPPPDSPFGPSFGDYPMEEVPEAPHPPVVSADGRVRQPAPSGIRWRVKMDEPPEAAPKPVLIAKGLVKWFGKRQVVRGVDVEVGAGEIVGLLGRNGAGKTTSFRMIMGLLHPDGGTVTYENRDVTRLPMYARANRGIGYLAQQPSIFQRLTVEQNLMAVLELQEPSRKIRKQRMEELIESLGLQTVRKSEASVLSGGERRRLEIARAMSLNPRVVLFDEPFAGIDPITVNEIQGILKDLKRQGVGVLVTDHNVRETLTITDRTYIMDEGKIWIHGHPREIVANEEARARYLGHEFRLDF